MTILVRPIVATDAAAIISLLNPIIRSGRYSSMTQVMTMDDQMEFIETLPLKRIYLAAIDETTQRLVGIQDVQPKENDGLIGEISTFVSLDSTRQGIGRSLSDATFMMARTIGFETLEAIIRTDNNAAIEFYRRMGFEVEDDEFDAICVSEKSIPRVLLEKWLA